jgi:uncharacterized damage-inducible protein DinB
MSLPGLSGTELLQWLEYTTQGWRDLIAQHPDALLLPCDIRETRTAGELLQHIVAVERRYAERLHGLKETPYDAIPSTEGDAIFAVHDQAMHLLRELTGRAETFWNEWLEFEARSGGRMRVPRQTVFAHLVLHSIRHYAQLATLVRQHGISPIFAMDYIVMRPSAPA